MPSTRGSSCRSTSWCGDRKVEERMVADSGYLRTIGGSALTDPSLDVPPADLRRPGTPASYVPFRNAPFLCIAVSGAEVIGAKNVYIGAVMADSSGYPDCRPEFYEAMNEAIRLGTKEGSGIAVRAPFVRLRKKDLVLMGKSLDVPFGRSWSCYREGEKACGRCDSRGLRLRAFAEAGVSDPIEYERESDRTGGPGAGGGRPPRWAAGAGRVPRRRK